MNIITDFVGKVVRAKTIDGRILQGTLTRHQGGAFYIVGYPADAIVAVDPALVQHGSQWHSGA